MFEGVLNMLVLRFHLVMFCHHSKHLMGYFEFLISLRMTCLLLNFSEKFKKQNVFEKKEEAETHRPDLC